MRRQPCLAYILLAQLVCPCLAHLHAHITVSQHNMYAANSTQLNNSRCTKNVLLILRSLEREMPFCWQLLCATGFLWIPQGQGIHCAIRTIVWSQMFTLILPISLWQPLCPFFIPYACEIWLCTGVQLIQVYSWWQLFKSGAQIQVCCFCCNLENHWPD